MKIHPIRRNILRLQNGSSADLGLIDTTAIFIYVLPNILP